MSEENYSKRELDERFKNIDSLIREKHDDVMIGMGELRVQTTSTNGRVRWLEKMQWLALGGLTVLTTFVFPIVRDYLTHH